MSTNVSNVRTLILTAVATFIAVIWWTTRGSEAVTITDVAPAVQVPRPRARAVVSVPATANVATPAPAPAPVLDEDAAASEAGFRAYVTGKYRYLFRAGALRPQAAAALQAALLERERIATTIRTAKQSSDQTLRASLPLLEGRLAVAEREIGAVLPAAEITSFDVLKDSDIEQFQLEDYAAGISNVAPVSENDKQSILYTKLLYRQRFRRVLDETGLMRDALTREQRQAAFVEVSRALERARDGYLREVRQYLYDDEQYQLLSNYENTEYSAELEKLRGIADGE